jgi:hypothetical protein
VLRWAAKRTIRGAGDLVVRRSGSGSRDLDVCIKSAQDWYPELSAGLAAAHRVVADPESADGERGDVERCARTILAIWRSIERRTAEL